MSGYKEGEIFVPYQNWSIVERNRLVNYYGGLLSFEQAVQNIYGGQDLTKIVSKIEICTTDLKNREVKITLKGVHGETVFRGINFKQLLVDSSAYLDNKSAKEKGWNKLSIQQRLEVCQNELSRWSVIFIDRKKGISLRGVNAAWIERMEIVNNCTTSRGFELKIRTMNQNYHGSFQIQKDEYRALCIEQAGSWARQGWVETKEEKKKSVLIELSDEHDAKTNPYFKDIYLSETIDKEELKINLDNYRTLSEQNRQYQIKVDLGKIDYVMFGEISSEYYSKPVERKLILQDGKNQYIEAIYNYETLYESKLRFPNFEETGYYNLGVILDEEAKKNKQRPWKIEKIIQFRELNNVNLYSITDRLYELVFNLQNSYKIVIGNIDLAELIGGKPGKNIFTLDRFCFHPRKTVTNYNSKSKSIKDYKKGEINPVYGFVLKGSKNIFVQPESWGIERAIFEYDGKDLHIYFISFERIIPIYHGIIKDFSLSVNEEA